MQILGILNKTCTIQIRTKQGPTVYVVALGYKLEHPRVGII